MGIFVSKLGASDRLGNQLQTQVPKLEFGTWRNPAFCRI
jgi:hypothetical protein